MKIIELPTELQESIISFVSDHKDLSSLRATNKSFHSCFEEHRQHLRRNLSNGRPSTIADLHASMRERHMCDDRDVDTAHALFIHLAAGGNAKGTQIDERRGIQVAETLLNYAGKSFLTEYLAKSLVVNRGDLSRNHLTWARVILSVTLLAHITDNSSAQEMVKIPLDDWLFHTEPYDAYDEPLEAPYTREEFNTAIHSIRTYIGAKGLATYLQAHLNIKATKSCDMYQAYLLGETFREWESDLETAVRLMKKVLRFSYSRAR